MTKTTRIEPQGPTGSGIGALGDWQKSRAGARAGRGFRYQDVVGAALLVSIWSGDRLPGRVVPEGWDDLVIEDEKSGFTYLQVKSRQPHRGPFTDREVASHLIDGWMRNEPRLNQAPSAFALVLEQSVARLPTGEHSLRSSPLADRFRPLLKESLASDRIDDIIQRSALWIWPDPSRDASDRLASGLNLPEAATLAHVNALRSAIGEAADRNASGAEYERAGLSVSDVAVIVDRMTELLDRDGLLEAVSLGLCEAVDFLAPSDDDLFYTGVDVIPGHVSAGLTFERPDTVQAVHSGLEERKAVLVAGPSGSGKSAILWMAAYENRGCRWYRVKRLSQAEHVDSLVRLARALLPNERAPVGFVVDNVGQVGTEVWDSLVQEMSLLPGTRVLGAAREEDLFLLRTLPRLLVIRPVLDEQLAAAIYAELEARGQTGWQYWREPFERSDGLLLEYIHLLTAGQRLQDVIAEQVRARRRERRDLELTILSIGGTAATWGAEVELPSLTTFLGESETAVSSALERLVGEHLLQQHADGTIAGLHRLRSRAIYTAIHDQPPPTAAQSITTTVGLLPAGHLHPFLVGVLSENPGMVGDVTRAAASRLDSETNPDIVTAIFQALRTVEFRTIAQEWFDVFNEEHLPLAMQPLAAQMVIGGLSLDAVSEVLDPRLVSAVQRLEGHQKSGSSLRTQLLTELPGGWASRCIAGQRDCRSAARLLASLEGLGAAASDLQNLPDLRGSQLAEALRREDVRSISDVIAAGRRVSIGTAQRLAESAGGVQTLLETLEKTTPWCRNLRTGHPSDELLDGREVEGLSPSTLVARVEYRYVSDFVEQELHGETVDLARLIMALHPHIELVRAVAIDARNRPHGIGDFEVASKWLKREVLPPSDQVAWNRARARLVESMLSAESYTDRVVAELDLLEGAGELLHTFGTYWLTGRRPGNLHQLDRKRRAFLEAVDALPPEPVYTESRLDPLVLGPGANLDAVQSLLRDCLGNIIPRLANPDDNLAPLAAFIEHKIAKDLITTTEPQRWRLIGYNDTPDVVVEFATVLRDLGAIVSEVTFGRLTLGEIRRLIQTVGRERKLGAAAELARSEALRRFDSACHQMANASEHTGAKVEVLARPSSRGATAWPPLDVLFIVHVDRLDQWVSAADALAAGRGHLSDTHQVSAVPVRNGVAVPFLGRVILPERRVVLSGQAYQWDEHAWQDWRPGGRHLDQGASPTFRHLLGSAITLSSLAALPGGVRPGIEAEFESTFEATVDEELRSLEQVAENHPGCPLLEEAVAIARVVVDSAKQELTSSDDNRGEVARWGLNMIDGVEDDLVRRVNGAAFLLAEWDIDPESANEWYAELTDQ